MSFFGEKEFYLEIAKGNVPGHSILQLAGINMAVGLVFEDIWDAGVFSSLGYNTQAANFTPGLVLTGADSLATAVIVTDVDAGATGTLLIRKISGVFTAAEIITDSSTGSATTAAVIAPILSLSYPTAGETWEIICESANDTSAGTGARTVEIAYLDDTGVEQTETKILNGQTAVTFTATDAFRFRSAIVKTWGSATNDVYGKTNLGSIVIRDSSSKDIRGSIMFDDSISGDEHGFNNSLDSHFTVPLGKTAFPVFVSTNVTKNHDVNLRALSRLTGTDGFATAGAMSNYQNSFLEYLDIGPQGLPALADIKFVGRSNNAAVSVNIQVIFILVDD